MLAISRAQFAALHDASFALFATRLHAFIKEHINEEIDMASITEAIKYGRNFGLEREPECALFVSIVASVHKIDLRSSFDWVETIMNRENLSTGTRLARLRDRALQRIAEGRL